MWMPTKNAEREAGGTHELQNNYVDVYIYK